MDKCPDEAIKRERADEDCAHYAWVSRKVLQHCPTGGNEILSRDNFLGPVLSRSIVDKYPDAGQKSGRETFSKIRDFCWIFLTQNMIK